MEAFILDVKIFLRNLEKRGLLSFHFIVLVLQFCWGSGIAVGFRMAVGVFDQIFLRDSWVIPAYSRRVVSDQRSGVPPRKVDARIDR